MHPKSKSQNGASLANLEMVCRLLFVSAAVSQDYHKLNVSAGTGFTVPNGRAELYPAGNFHDDLCKDLTYTPATFGNRW